MKQFFHFISDRFIHAFLFGFIYFLLESGYKGHWTDWRMFVLSAIIGILIGSMNELFTYDTDFKLQCIVGMLLALLCECIFGYQWNIIECRSIWNYTSLPLSAVAGQINFFFAVIWLFLSGVCIGLDDTIAWKFHKNSEVPYYKIGNKVVFRFPERTVIK